MRAAFLAAFTAVAMGGAALPVKAGAKGNVVLKPADGQSFEVGSGKAVGYFLAKNGACELTLMVAPIGDLDDVKGAGSRVRFTVAPGQTGAFESPEGGALQFSCAGDAKSLTVKPFQRVAFAETKAN